MESNPFLPCNYRGSTIRRQFESVKPILRRNTTLNDRTFVGKEKNSGKIVKRIFWQTSITTPRPNLKIQVNGVIIVGMPETGVDCSIIIPEQWHPSWSLEDVNIQFLGIGSIRQVKNRSRWFECTETEGQRGFQKPYVTNIAINLWGYDLYQQWNTQVNIPLKQK